jgi:RES domain-containing protein
LPLDDEQLAALANLPIRRISGLYFRQTAPSRQPFDLPDLARRDARWHRKGDPWPAYAGRPPLAVMLEQARYVALMPGEEVLPVRRLSELHVSDLATIDLANPLALDQLKLATDDLRGDRTLEFCRELADAAWATHPDAHALLVPSTPLDGANVLVIRPTAFAAIAVGKQSLVQLLPMAVEPDEDDDVGGASGSP